MLFVCVWLAAADGAEGTMYEAGETMQSKARRR